MRSTLSNSIKSVFKVPTQFICYRLSAQQNISVMTTTPYVRGEEAGTLESTEDMNEWDTPLFAFHDLDYIPSGYSGILAPYIETGPGSKHSFS